jgi:adenylate cyclase
MAFDRTKLIDWMLGPRGRSLEFPEFFAQLSQRICDEGVPLRRAHVGTRTMHPEVWVRIFNWWDDVGETVMDTMPHSLSETSMVTRSPVATLVQNDGETVRVRLEVPEDEISYPVCRELKEKGCTDYLLMRLTSYRAAHNVCSFCSGTEGGFTDKQIAFLTDLLPSIAIRVELDTTYFAARALLRTYLGRNASERVLAGSFRRGTGEQMDAAIWMSDLRGFTARVDKDPLPMVLEALNTYFTCVADTIVAHGGEVLKFIGDAVLAVFPLSEDPQAACRSALDAAEQAFARIEEANKERQASGFDELQFGVVLHRGDVMYGNIGATERLDFTVIGSAVNEASRVESLCKTLGSPLLFTEQFADVAEDERAVSLGRHELRGVSRPPEIFTHAQFIES